MKENKIKTRNKNSTNVRMHHAVNATEWKWMTASFCNQRAKRIGQLFSSSSRARNARFNWQRL